MSILVEIKNKFKKFLKNKWAVCLLILINTLSFICILILSIVKLVDYNWLSGLVLGSISFWLGLLIEYKSFNVIQNSENHFLLYFLFLLRLGIYAIPLFIAFLNDNNLFHFAGVLIGLSPLILTPFVISKIKKV